ncbi:MAG TPA: Plug domain-containing protein, partial [Burkholderiaceae bacterium]|nr:Plug domain-containing protein [Burkholderiaceae bacterium]
MLAAWLAAVLPSVQAQGPQELPPVTVVGTVPLVGHDLPADRIPASVYVVDAEQIRRDRPLTIADQINRGVASVFVNAAQGNPYQPDITFRGFAASPLLGTPIGMSVFVDG